MSHCVEVKPGQSFQDGTGLKVRIAKIDVSDRVHFCVTEDCGDPGAGRGQIPEHVALYQWMLKNSIRD